jgi:WD40 repeat protein
VIENLSAADTLDGKRLAVVSRGALGTLELASGKITVTSTKKSDVDMAAAGGLIAVVDEIHEDSIEVLDAASGKQVAKLAIPEIEAFTFSADGSQLAIAADGKLQLWTRKTGKLTPVGENPAPFSALAFAPDGRLASGDRTGTIRIWKLGSSPQYTEIVAHLGRVDGLFWRGTTLASAAADYQVKLWDVP